MLNKLEQLSGTDMNSILLDLFVRRTQNISPIGVLTQFDQNRFTTPSTIDVIAFKQMELQWLQLAATKKFKPVQLSPLAPLGTCSTFKTVHQNNIVSATRGTEVMSDATNVFALLAAQYYKKTKSHTAIKFVTAERLVRAQGLAHPGHSAHFGIFCMASAGFNRGSFLFEMEQLTEHLSLHLELLSSFNKTDLTIKILLKENNEALCATVQSAIKNISESYSTEIIHQQDPNNYYGLVQFKTFLNYKGKEINLSDGGFVDWTQQLLSNKKHRLLISGIGIELVFKILTGVI